MIDVLDYCVMADKSKGLTFSRQTHGWEGVAFDALTTDKWTRIKNVQGWPWDIKLFDTVSVRDWITEEDWVSPNDYKKNVQNYFNQATGLMIDGIYMFPRYIPSPTTANPTGFFRTERLTLKANSDFRIFKNCVWDNVPHDIGDVKHTLTGPYQMNIGGDVGVQPTLIHQFFWNGSAGSYGVMEENWYTLNYGWVHWSVSSLSGGQYNPTNFSNHNKLIKMAVPTSIFPCF